MATNLRINANHQTIAYEGSHSGLVLCYSCITSMSLVSNLAQPFKPRHCSLYQILYLDSSKETFFQKRSAWFIYLFVYFPPLSVLTLTTTLSNSLSQPLCVHVITQTHLSSCVPLIVINLIIILKFVHIQLNTFVI